MTLQTVCDRKGEVGFAFGFDSIRPDGHRDVGPVVLAVLQLLPTLFEVVAPGLVTEKARKRRGGELNTVKVGA